MQYIASERRLLLVITTSLLIVVIQQVSAGFCNSIRHDRGRTAAQSRPIQIIMPAAADHENNDSYHTLTVHYQGATAQLPVGANETILAALERQREAIRLGLPTLPYDCRRGNCGTCAASHTAHSARSNLRTHDGLAPARSREMAQHGFVLTCSATITGPGVELHLNTHDAAWQYLYHDRLLAADTQDVARHAMANVIRKAHERNLPGYVQQTERTFRDSPYNVR